MCGGLNVCYGWLLYHLSYLELAHLPFVALVFIYYK